MQQRSSHSGCSSRSHLRRPYNNDVDEVYARVRRHSTHLPLRRREYVVDVSSSAATLNMSNTARSSSFHHGSSSSRTTASRRCSNTVTSAPATATNNNRGSMSSSKRSIYAPTLRDPPGNSWSSQRSAAATNISNRRRGSMSSSKRSIYTPTLRDAAAYSPNTSNASSAADETEDTSTASSSEEAPPPSSSWDGRSKHYSAHKVVSYNDTVRRKRHLGAGSGASKGQRNDSRLSSTTQKLINNNNRQPCNDIISARRGSGSVVAPKKKQFEEESNSNSVVTTQENNNYVMKFLSVMTKKLLLPAMMLPVIFIRASTCNKKIMMTRADDDESSDSDDDDSDDDDSRKGTVTTYCSDDSSSSPSSSSSSSNDSQNISGKRLITSYYHYSSTTLDDDGDRELTWCKKQRQEHRDIIKKNHGVVIIGKEKLNGENISSYYRDCVDDLVNENIRLYHKIVFLSQDREDILRQLCNHERGVNDNLRGRTHNNAIQGSRPKSFLTEDSSKKSQHYNKCIVILDDNIVKIIEAENAAASKLFSSSLHCIHEATDDKDHVEEEQEERGNLELSAMGNEIMNLVSKICNFGVNVIPSNSSTYINSNNKNASNKNDNKCDKKNDKIAIDKKSSSTPPESVGCESKTSSSDGAPFSVTSITVVNDSARFTDVTTEVHCVDTSGRSSTTTKSYCKRLGAIDGDDDDDDDVDDHDDDASSDLEGVEDDSDKSHTRKAITAHYFIGCYDDERVGKENNDDVFTDKDFSVESVESVDYHTMKYCYSRCSSYAPEKRAVVTAVEASEAELSKMNVVNTDDLKSCSNASGIGEEPHQACVVNFPSPSASNNTSFSREGTSVVSINTPSNPSSSERTVSDDAFGNLALLIERLQNQRGNNMTISERGMSTSSSTAYDNDDNLDVNVNSSTDNSSSSVEHVDASLRSSTTTNTIGVTSITIDSFIAANSAPSTLDDKQNITRGLHGIDSSRRSSITTMSSSKPSTEREVNLRRARDLLSGSDRTYTSSTNNTSSSSERQFSPVSLARGTNLRRASDLLRTSTVTHDTSSSNEGQDHLSPNVITSVSTISRSPTPSNASPSDTNISSSSSKSPPTSQSNSIALSNDASSTLKSLYTSNITLPFSTTSDVGVQSTKSPPPSIVDTAQSRVLNWLPDEQYSFVNVQTTSTTATTTTVVGQSTSSSISSSEGSSTREYKTITITAISRSSKYLSFPSSCSHTYVTYFKASMSMVQVTSVLEEHLLLVRTRLESSSIDRHQSKVGKKKYIGEYNKEGKKHGYGLYTSKNGNIYLGEWYNDNREGLGIVKIGNGDIFEGQFANNLKCGIGVYHYNDGERDLSFYTNDVRVGDSIRFTADRKETYLISASNPSKSKLISLEMAAQLAEGMGAIIDVYSDPP